MTKSKNKMTPAKLRLVLVGTIVLLLGLSAAGFWLFNEQLHGYSAEVQKANAAASTSSSDIARLEKLETELEEDKIAVTRAKNIVADSKYYQYQDQIIADITAYAKAAKLQVVSIAFADVAAKPAAGVVATPAAPVPSGLKSISASVTLKNPVDYRNLMRFIHSIELNLTKMQLTGVSLQRDPVTGDINVNPLTIEVYTR